MNKDSTQSFKEVFSQFLKEEHLDDKFHEQQLINSWKKIMGRTIAGRTTKIFVKKRTLYVELSSAALKEEMNRSRKLVLTRISEQSEKMIVDEVKFI